MSTPTRTFRIGPELVALIAASATLLVLRAIAASRLGYGDSEALYASYALHPQLAYLDHPGFVGLVARALGRGTAPLPCRAHAATAVLATLVPWAMALACRACGATWRRSLGAGLVFAVVPEMAIGLFALTPDLPLALAWVGALGCAAAALRAPPRSARASCAFVAAGLCAGIAASAKVSGGLLLAPLALAYGSRPARPHARTAAPWVGLSAGVVLVAPIVAFESSTGWPMLRHRLVDTQASAGISLRNAGAVVGGQLAYLSPLLAVIAVLVVRVAWRDRRDAVGSLLFYACALPAAALVPLCLWSRVAEPHWLAPAELSLIPVGARALAIPCRRLLGVAVAIAAVIVLAVHAWVLVPSFARLAPAYDARVDISNELYGWPDVLAAVREEAARAASPTSRPGDPVVVGPHWIICAQLEAGLRGGLRVGCNTPVRDDFDAWWPRERWHHAQAIIWVTDARFGAPPPLAGHTVLRTREVEIERAGRRVRRFTIATFVSHAAHDAPEQPRILR